MQAECILRARHCRKKGAFSLYNLAKTQHSCSPAAKEPYVVVYGHDWHQCQRGFPWANLTNIS